MDALCRNVLALRSLLPKDCKLMPALKANAYGHGALPVAKALQQMGIDSFCVACISEAAALRKNGIKGEILILGYTHPKQFPLLRLYRLTQTVVDYAYAETLNQYGKKLHVHIGIDTGMHRLGERHENLEQIRKIFNMKYLKIDGAFTHLCADDTENPKDRDFTLKQAEAFYDVMEKLKREGYVCPKIHLQATYGILNYPALAGNYARAGIALYGILSSDTDFDRSHTKLFPVLSLKARISSVRELHAQESAGYGLAFTAKRPTRLASLAIGYADGLPRGLSCGTGSVLIKGKRAPIVGRICMDQTLVDVTDIPEAAAGDIAVLIGKSGEDEITAYELAAKTGTITNEILSRIGERVVRV